MSNFLDLDYRGCSSLSVHFVPGTISHDNYMKKEFYCLLEDEKTELHCGEATCPKPQLVRLPGLVPPTSAPLCLCVNDMLAISKRDYFHVLDLAL